MVRSIKACSRNNHKYHIDIDKSTDSNGAVVEFDIRLFYRESENGNVEEHVVAIINRSGNRAVFKKLFLKNKPSKVTNLDYYKSIRKIDNNWESYADKYENNHNP